MAGIEVWTNGDQKGFVAILQVLNDTPVAERTLNKISRAANLSPQRTRELMYGGIGNGWITREYIGNMVLLSITPVGKSALHVLKKAPPDIFIDTPQHKVKTKAKSKVVSNQSPDTSNDMSNDTSTTDKRTIGDKGEEEDDEWKDERMGDQTLQR